MALWPFWRRKAPEKSAPKASDAVSAEDMIFVLETMREIGNALGQAQAFNRANQYILREVVRELAMQSEDPHKYLADMFERVSARADLGAIESEAHPSTAEFRRIVENFFRIDRMDPKK